MRSFTLAVCCILGGVACAPAQSSLKTAGRFAVTLDGVPVKGVRSVNGLESQLAPARMPGTSGKPSEAAGASTPKTFVITWATAPGNDVLLQWHKNARGGSMLRTMVVRIMNAQGQAVRTFTFNQCKPLTYRMSAGAGKSGVPVEKLKVACGSEFF